MTRERLYRSYIEELCFFNPQLRDRDSLKDFLEVSNFSDLTWIDLYYGPEVVGFILVVNGEHCTPDADFMIMETYMHPDYREKGIVFRAIENLFANNPGRWGLFILNLNKGARKFWRQGFDAHKDDVSRVEDVTKQYNTPYVTYHLWEVKKDLKRAPEVKNTKEAS